VGTEKGYMHPEFTSRRHRAPTASLTPPILFRLGYLDHFGWVVDVTVVTVFRWVKVVIDRGNDLLRGTVDLFPFPFRQHGQDFEVLGDPSSPRLSDEALLGLPVWRIAGFP